ncbi:GlxA family transcriptional regulator [Kribbella sp. NPDC056345]|uniref:GlxA family transcriptional regulator n=1 Tax=Kribbella sp. NPDC056345 TaxID=3345789 RepID=UPI0035D6C080
MAELVVALLNLPRAIPLDLGIAAHVFGRHDGYRVIEDSDPVTAAGADIIVVPGFDEPERPPPAPYLELLRDTPARLLGICTGTFALAAAGVLDGREATTHWHYTDQLRSLHPQVTVLENRLYVEDGRVLTSGGGGAGIDAGLHVIRTDYGAAAAHEVGKWVLAAPERGGEHRQYADVLTPLRSDLGPVRAWVQDHLAEPITVDQLATQAALSRRTFIRRFEHETGLPPMRWVVLQRLLSARRLLETSDWTVDRIAAASGFGSATSLREAFRRELGTSPSSYRAESRAAMS